MKLIDADEAVRKAQVQIEQLQKEEKKIMAIKPQNKEEEQRKKDKLEYLKHKLVGKAELLIFLIYDCEEVKALGVEVEEVLGKED